MQPLAADLGLERGRGAGRDDAAVVEHDEVVGELLGLLQVLRGQQHGGAVDGQRADLVPDLVAVAGVQPGGRLVEEQHVRAADEAHGEVEPAAHAPGVGAHPAARGVGEAEPRDQFGGAVPGLAAGQAEQPGDQHEVVRAGQRLVDGGVLPGQPDPGAHRRGFGDDVVAQHAGTPGVRAQQRGEHAHGGGLARAVRPEQAEHGAAADREVHAVERPGRPEALAQVLDLDDGVHAGSMRRGSDRTLTAR